MDSSEGGADTPGAADKAPEHKPKRVRTGCLTCRQRHLKCDEGKPICNNCRKSNRSCETGVRLNFIDTRVKRPPLLAPAAEDYQIHFEDNSREIASGYVNGLSRYGPVENAIPSSGSYNLPMDMQVPNPMPPPHQAPRQPLPPMPGMLPEGFSEDAHDLVYDHQHHRAPSHHHTDSSYTAGGSGYGGEHSATPHDVQRDYLTTQEEVLYMQVFVDEVAKWMDSMDPEKHFSRLLPFQAIREPMLLNAFMACGALHLAHLNDKHDEKIAEHYYKNAVDIVMRAIENANRNSVICATAAVVLNVYEIMSEKALQRMNHLAATRALMKECGWNARSKGIGAACFWLHVGMELLSVLHFNWQMAWNPDEWGVDMDFTRSTDPGHEDVWCHRIVYIVAKLANYRATAPRDPEQMRMPGRVQEWEHIKKLTDSWNESVPRTMHPMAYLYPGHPGRQSSSLFPKVWMIKRTSTVARLFYHTAQCLLAQCHPLHGPEEPEMHQVLHQHALIICGIVAHEPDRGIASVALRSLAIAAEVLQNRAEQEEVLGIFDSIRVNTGWRVGFLNNELRQKWGWNKQQLQQQQQQQQQQPAQPQEVHDPNMGNHIQGENMAYQHPPATHAPIQHPPAPAPQQIRGPPPAHLNPMMAQPDYTIPQHPYQQHYVAPNSVHDAQNSLAQLAHQANGGYY